MKIINTAIISILAAAIGTTSTIAQQFKPPENWVGPNWDPTGTTFETVKVGTGVYSLITNHLMADNSGFVVGDKGVLVIDAGLNRDTVRRVRAAVKAVTDQPIKYIPNTTSYGDHTFGNGFFGPDVTLIQHTKIANKIVQPQLDLFRRILAQRGNAKILDDIVLRKPDLTFDQKMVIDLADITVEMHHFGHGNTAGDTVIYVPSTKTAWTGNMVFGDKSIAWGSSGKLDAYRDTLTNFSESLDVDLIIAGHNGTGNKETIENRIAYLDATIKGIDDAIAQNLSLEQAYETVILDSSFLPTEGSTFAPNIPFFHSAHRWNIKMRYLEKGKI